MKAKTTNKPKIVISFDLIVKECKSVFGGSRSKAYNVLKKELAKHGFIHDQGSGYISEKGLSRLELLDTLNSVITQQPWLVKCCKKLRISEVAESLLDGLAHKDLISLIATQGSVSTIIPQPRPKNITPTPPQPEQEKSPCKYTDEEIWESIKQRTKRPTKSNDNDGFSM